MPGDEHADRPVPRGRPAATSRDEIERAAFALFERHGFEATTITMISDELGVSRRTIARYFVSKNDIPWGHFDLTLPRFHELLAQSSPELPLWQRVHDGVVRFNEFPDDAIPSHRTRMTIILTTPSLQAHSVIRNARWKTTVEDFVRGQLGPAPVDSPLPAVIGHVSMALATAAYERWLAADSPRSADLRACMEQSMRVLRDYLSEEITARRSR